jgi:hypothetical protein
MLLGWVGCGGSWAGVPQLVWPGAQLPGRIPQQNGGSDRCQVYSKRFYQMIRHIWGFLFFKELDHLTSIFLKIFKLFMMIYIIDSLYCKAFFKISVAFWFFKNGIQKVSHLSFDYDKHTLFWYNHEQSKTATDFSWKFPLTPNIKVYMWKPNIFAVKS